MDDQQKQGFAGCGCFLIILILVALTGGAWRTEVVYTPPVPGTVAEQVQFSEDLNARHWVAGIFQGEQPDLQQAVKKHVTEGTQLLQMTVTTKHTLVDTLLTGITLGIYCPVTVNVRGTVGKVTPEPKAESKPQPATESKPATVPQKKK